MPSPAIPRPALVEALQELLDAPGPRVVVVSGPPGSGKRRLLRSALEATRREGRWGAPPVWHRGDPAPASLTWRALAHALAGTAEDVSPGLSDPRETLQAWQRQMDDDRLARVLVLDGLHHLVAADSEAPGILAGLWKAVRARTLPLHLVIVTDDGDAPSPWADDDTPLFGEVDRLAVPPLSHGEVAAWLPGWSPRERLQLWCALGGDPGRLRHLDPREGLDRNLQRLVLDPDGPLHRAPVRELTRQLQKPERYHGVLRALATGAREWGDIRAYVPELAEGSRLAPYLASLEELGWVVSERSLDARPESRGRRYRLTDPFVGFWLSAVAPVQGRLLHESPQAVWTRQVASGLQRWVAHTLPWACRRALEEAAARPLSVPARRTGGLWGEGYDVPLAGILVTGASFYGHTVWGRGADEADADALEEQVRRTRFGFGRETRLRLLVSDGAPTEALVRRGARGSHLRVLRPDDFF